MSSVKFCSEYIEFFEGGFSDEYDSIYLFRVLPLHKSICDWFKWIPSIYLNKKPKEAVSYISLYFISYAKL